MGSRNRKKFAGMLDSSLHLFLRGHIFLCDVFRSGRGGCLKFQDIEKVAFFADIRFPTSFWCWKPIIQDSPTNDWLSGCEAFSVQSMAQSP